MHLIVVVQARTMHKVMFCTVKLLYFYVDDVAVKWRVVCLMPSALSTAGRAAAKT